MDLLLPHIRGCCMAKMAGRNRRTKGKRGEWKEKRAEREGWVGETDAELSAWRK